MKSGEVKKHTTFDDKGNKVKDYWGYDIAYYDIAYHRDDDPAVIQYYTDGNILAKIWYRHGMKHRKDGPAEILYTHRGSESDEKWYKRDKRHREDGPAHITYDSRGTIKYVKFYINDKLVDSLDDSLTKSALKKC